MVDYYQYIADNPSVVGGEQMATIYKEVANNLKAEFASVLSKGNVIFDNIT